MIFHGGGLDKAVEKYGGDKSAWLDLSTGINPNPYPVYGVDPLAWTRLPDTKAMGVLLKAARDYYNVRDDKELIAANGTQAIIEIIPRVINAKKVGIISPTYNEHANAWSKSGAEVVEIDFGTALPKGLDVLVLVNPNNPTGDIYDRQTLLNFSKQMQQLGGYVVVDEAFCDTQPENSITFEQPDNVIILKSFGKFFGLAGVRLGFAVACKTLIENISKQIGPWAVSGPALQIGARAFADKNWIEHTKTILKTLSKQQAEMLKELGIKVIGENPLFIYAEDARANVLYEQLAKHHILIRPFPERPNFLRFGICANREHLARLNSALENILNHG